MFSKILQKSKIIWYWFEPSDWSARHNQHFHCLLVKSLFCKQLLDQKQALGDTSLSPFYPPPPKQRSCHLQRRWVCTNKPSIQSQQKPTIANWINYYLLAYIGMLTQACTEVVLGVMKISCTPSLSIKYRQYENYHRQSELIRYSVIKGRYSTFHSL